MAHMKRFFEKVAEHMDKLDVESRRRQFTSLTNEIRFLESILNALDEGVIVVGAGGALLAANTAADTLSGADLSSRTDSPVRDVLPDWDWDALLRPPKGGPDWARKVSVEIEVAYPEHRILEVSSRPNGAAFVVLVRDVTLARSREADARASERTDAIKDLAAGIAHELGNPLNALSLNLQLLEREFRREPDAERRARLLADIATARKEVRRITDINSSFLSAMRPVRPNLAPGSLADPLSDTLAALKPQIEDRQIQVTVDLPPVLPSVLLDRAQMEQVFFNLVKNALEATKNGERLEIELASDDRDVTATFRDHAGGMSDDTLRHLFEPYRTTKKDGGHGLGLMLSQRIVRAHGGEIDVESKSGDGTRFIVRLPRFQKRVRRLADSVDATATSPSEEP